VQFVNERITPKHASFCLGNGFSDTWYFCKDKGDFYWATAPKHIEFSTMNDPPIAEDLPITSGTAYVSCFNVVNLFLTYQWAKRYPKVKFVAGGPSVRSAYYNKNDIPSNLHITDDSVEEYFGIPNLSQKWGLELPNIIKEENPIMFTYAINNTCYNRSCVFCSHDWSDKKRIKTNLQFEFKDISNYKFVFLNFPSVTPQFLLEELPNSPVTNNYKYLIFMRPDKIMNDLLPQVLEKRKQNSNKPDITIVIGIDFLSDRMLNNIRKNHSLKDAETTLKILTTYNIDCSVTSILGWPNLEQNDIEQAKSFLSIPEVKNVQWIVNQLQAKVNTYIHNEKTIFKGVPHYLGPFCVGFDLDLTKEQRYLNDQVRQLFKDNIPNDMLVDRYYKCRNQHYNY